ncbi:hypothetical protein COB55_05035 [Candidatus Wolfebacteria bacterium]|nr:MAG: hypothetical protein COB55_05035 [Candidatus Wolfebacteria bacterium]
MKRAFTLTIVTLVFLLGFAFSVSAQEITVGLSDVLDVQVSPEYPRAFESVNISVRSYNSDFNRANITWYLNGTPELKGIGKTNFTFKTSGVGQTTTVRMDARTAGGGIVSRTFSFRPGDVDLLWEADTYTPPFYKGKKLHSNEGTLRVVALPTILEKDGSIANPKNLVYKWRLGSKVMDDESGFGKQSITFHKDVTFKSNFNVTVVVSTLDDSSSAQSTLRVTPVNPLVILYENNPVLGVMYNKALSTEETLSLTENEVSISAHPFFFDVTSASSNRLNYRWFMNGKSLDTPKIPNDLTLRKIGGSGRAQLRLRLQHTDNILQGAETETTIHYSSNSSSIF